jgi:protein N-terminal amidase
MTSNVNIEDLKIICVQILPVHLDPASSISKAEAMLSKYSTADILVFPEMAFTGYTFSDLSEISPILEEPKPGFLTFDWCSNQARRLTSYVFCGYAEKSGEKGYNSMMVLSPEGLLMTNYRKSFLYTLDKTWADEGSGFQSISMTIRGKVLKAGLGICMDINPYEFTAPFESFELATFWEKEDVDLCIFCTNWTASDGDEGMNLLNYWLTRMTPLIQSNRKRFFIAADRVGEERGTSYMGNSCILELTRRPKLIARLDRYSEKVLSYP